MNSNEEKIDAHEEGHKGSHCHSHWRGRCWKFPFVFALIIAIKSAVVMALWNCLMPEVFHLATLTYVQAIELTILARLLVGFAGHGPFGRWRHHGGPWKQHWMKLSPEERAKLRDEWRSRCRH